MDPEKFRLVNEGVSGESKGLFLREDGTTIPKKTFYTEIVAHDLFWWKVRAWLSTVCYLTILEPDFFPLQACEDFCDLLHDIILSPMSNNAKLPIGQCKVAWKCTIAAFHIKIHQSSCSLQSLTKVEMEWKHHWAWHQGPRASLAEDATGGSERSTQSQLDRAINRIENKIQTGLGKARRARGGGKGGRGGAGGGKGAGGAKSDSSKGGWNNQKPPTPPQPPGGQQAGRKSAGRNAWAKRQKKGNGA